MLASTHSVTSEVLNGYLLGNDILIRAHICICDVLPTWYSIAAVVRHGGLDRKFNFNFSFTRMLNLRFISRGT